MRFDSMSLRRAGGSLGFALVALLAPPPAHAEEAVETAVRSWVAAVDALPDWRATFDTIAVVDGRATRARAEG